jgi:hypothetical protein
MTGVASPPLQGHPHAATAAALIVYLSLLVLAGIWVAVHVARHRDEPGDDDSDHDEGGGLRRPKPTGPRPDPGPDWWPEFERQFAAYVESRLTRSG